MATFSDTTLNSRVKEAAVILKSYLRLDIENCEAVITNVLNGIGIDDTEIGLKILNSAATTHADFNQSFKALGHNLPEARVITAMMMLKGQNPFEEKEASMPHSDLSIIDAIKTMKPIGQWSDTELLEKYGKHGPMQVEEELSKRSKGRPCIIFNKDETINIQQSLPLLRQARHLNTPESYIIGDEMYQVYCIGEYPMNVLYECPIHHDVLLVNEYCEECGLKWSDFEKQKDKYVFLRLIAQYNKSIDPIALRTYLLQSFSELAKLFPKILLKFNALKEEEKLPTLKRRVSKSQQGDPFRIIHKEY